MVLVGEILDRILRYTMCVFVNLVLLACPRIVPKAEWGGTYVSHVALPYRPAPYAVIHHSTGDNCPDFESCSAQMRYLEMLHIQIFGWTDIAYNFCVGNDGVVYEGRGWGRQGLHAPHFNQMSMGICFLGTYTSTLPSEEAMQAARDLLDCGITESEMEPTYYIVGHRQDVNTECPGETLFQEIRTWDRFMDM